MVFCRGRMGMVNVCCACSWNENGIQLGLGSATLIL
jgi:hypothetical protein